MIAMIGLLDDGAIIGLLNGMTVIKNNVQKASIKEGLLPIAWHPSRYWDWCLSEDEKQETEKLWA